MRESQYAFEEVKEMFSLEAILAYHDPGKDTSSVAEGLVLTRLFLIVKDDEFCLLLHPRVPPPRKTWTKKPESQNRGKGESREKEKRDKQKWILLACFILYHKEYNYFFLLV